MLVVNASIALLIVLLALYAVSFYESPDEKYERVLSEREPMSAAEFYSAFYSDTNIPNDLVLRLRPVLAASLGVDESKLMPHDDWPPVCNELDCTDVIETLEREFDVQFSVRDLERLDPSFDSLVRYLADHQDSV